MTEEISELIEKYNNNCPEKWTITKYNGFKIHFPYQIMIDLTKEIIVDKTVFYLYEIIDHVKNINSIIYAGTVSKNSYIISMIQNQLPTNISYCVTPHPSLAVARGAVMFGMNPLVIKSRIARLNIGVQTSEKWNEIRHGKRKDLKYFCPIEKFYKCSKIFSPIILKNKKISVDELVRKNYRLIAPKTSIIFFKTDFNNAYFIDNPFKKCELLGKIQFDAGEEYDENDRDLTIELKFGGTFIDARIKYKEVEKSSPIFFQ